MQSCKHEYEDKFTKKYLFLSKLQSVPVILFILCVRKNIAPPQNDPQRESIRIDFC